MQLGAKREIKAKLQSEEKRSSWAIVELHVEVGSSMSSRQREKRRKDQGKESHIVELSADLEPSVPSHEELATSLRH